MAAASLGESGLGGNTNRNAIDLTATQSNSSAINLIDDFLVIGIDPDKFRNENELNKCILDKEQMKT